MTQFPTAQDAISIVERVHGVPVRSCERFTTGLAHFVYGVLLDDGRRVVARLATRGGGNAFAGGVYWSEQLRPLGVPLPQILAVEPHPVVDSFPFMLLERLPGVDLHFAYPCLTGEHKRRLAHRLVAIQRIAGGLRQGDGFGYGSSPTDPSLHQNWSDVLHTQLQTARHRIESVGKVPAIHVDRVEQRLHDFRHDLAAIEPICFLDDTTTKNVLIDEGRLTGIVDVDTVCFGDPLMTPALTHMALLTSDYATDYVDFWIEELEMNSSQRKLLALYTAIFCVIFLSELGQRFNKEATPEVDKIEVARLIRILGNLLDQT